MFDAVLQRDAIRTTRYSYGKSSVRPPVTLVDCDHTGWNSEKYGLRSLQTPTSWFYSKGNTWNFGRCI